MTGYAELTKIETQLLVALSRDFLTECLYRELDKKKQPNYGRNKMIEPLLLGIVLGLIPVTLAGLFYAAYVQYKRGNQLEIE